MHSRKEELVHATAPRGGCVRAQAIALTERHSLAAAAELCAAARARSPHAAMLGDRALAIAVARGTPAVASPPLTLCLLRVRGPAPPMLSAPDVPRPSVKAGQPPFTVRLVASSRPTCMFNVLALAVYMGRTRVRNSARLGRPTCLGVSAYTCYMMQTARTSRVSPQSSQAPGSSSAASASQADRESGRRWRRRWRRRGQRPERPGRPSHAQGCEAATMVPLRFAGLQREKGQLHCLRLSYSLGLDG